ncbi:M23 family metallopeptidase [Candidatus Kaiserbacteria bacterium]|nr:M23 family metallopeptidase [Candidatus Kaiserbacteria bacterium]
MGKAVSLISLLILVGSVLPASARAFVLSDFFASLRGAAEEEVSYSGNLQTLPLPKPAMNVDPSAGRGGGDILIVDGSALFPEEGPSGTIADIEKPKNSTISIYIVRPGDTLSGIAEMFDVSVNTILWANDLPRASRIQVGQALTILPVTGIKYTVKKGDTLASIAKRYGGDADEIASYNGVEGALTAGTEIIIPDGEVPAPVSVPRRPASAYATSAGTPSQAGYYLRPIAGGIRSQGLHGYNGVDLAAPSGTPIFASAEGDVIVAKDTGWNGGYGQYVVIQHPNGSQTLYSHASSVIVSVGQHVQQGQVIAYVGRTGKATGAHVHFEIRNGIRNPF